VNKNKQNTFAHVGGKTNIKKAVKRVKKITWG